MPSYTQYKRQMAVLDADDSEIESWITVRGNHIPIMKGQSKGDAVKAFIEHQAGKNDVPQGTKWTPTNKKGEGTGNQPKQEKPKYDIRHGARVPDIESYINEYADRHTPNSWREEENFIAEKLKQDGLYAYGSDIKKAMKNVYGDVYEQERAEEVRLDKAGKLDKLAGAGRAKKEYDPDFETVRKNAKANHYLYGGKYTQRSKQAAYKEWKHDTSSEENLRAANKWVNSELVPKQSKPSDSSEAKFGRSDAEAIQAWEDIEKADTRPESLKKADLEYYKAKKQGDMKKAYQKWKQYKREETKWEESKKLSKPSDASGGGKKANVANELDDVFTGSYDVPEYVEKMRNIVDKHYSARKVSDWERRSEGIQFFSDDTGRWGTTTEMSVDKELGDYILKAPSHRQEELLRYLKDIFLENDRNGGWQVADPRDILGKLSSTKAKNGKYTFQVNTSFYDMYHD